MSAVTLEQVVRLAEQLELRAAGAFEGVESLRNKFADPPLALGDECGVRP